MAKQEINEETGQRGSIVAISSISALMGGGEQCHYTPTKAGIKSLMESTAIALGPLGIRCNSVLPGKSRGRGARALGPQVRACSEQPTRHLPPVKQDLSSFRHYIVPSSLFVNLYENRNSPP